MAGRRKRRPERRKRARRNNLRKRAEGRRQAEVAGRQGVGEGSESDAPGRCPCHPGAVVVRDSCARCGWWSESNGALANGRPVRAGVTPQVHFWLALIPSLAVVFLDAVADAPLARTLGDRARIIGPAQLFLSLPVLLWGAWPLCRRMLSAARGGRVNGFTLLMVAGVLSFLGGVDGLLSPARRMLAHPTVGFPEAVLVVEAGLLVCMLAARTRDESRAVLDRVLGSLPPVARRVGEDGSEERVPRAQISSGDLLQVRPGERVPADGHVVAGRAPVDESNLTGEGIAVLKDVGSPMTAGSLNRGAPLTVRAETATTTVAERLAAAARQSLRGGMHLPARAVPLADALPWAVLALAAVAAGGWWATSPALAPMVASSILLAGSPWILQAAPVAVVAALYRGAGEGILFRDAAALDAFAGVDTVVVGKGGMLTSGRPRMVTAAAAAPFGEAELLRFVAAVEHASGHRVGAAVVRGAEERGIGIEPVTGFARLPGRGVQGVVDGRMVLVGTSGLLAEKGIDPAPLEAQADVIRRHGHSAIFVAVDGVAAGLLSISDSIRATTPEAVEQLRRDRIRVVVVSEDHPSVAAAITERLGIADVHAGGGPDEKRAVVEDLQRRGRRVAVVGSREEDASALAAADVAVLAGSETQLALSAEPVALVRGDLRAVARVARLARTAHRATRLTVALALATLAITLPVAAGATYPFTGTVPPPVAMAALLVAVHAVATRIASSPLRTPL